MNSKVRSVSPVPRWERWARALLFTLVTCLAFGGSFVHTHEALVKYGQDEQLAWALAGIPDLLAALAGLQMRQALREGLSLLPARIVLVTAGLATLAAQAVTAVPGKGGLIAAMSPAIAFLLVVWLIETSRPVRPAAAAAQPARPAHRQPAPAPVQPVAEPAPPAAPPAVPAPQRTAEVKPPPVQAEPVTALQAVPEAPRQQSKAEVIAALTEEIRATGEGWRPDYGALMATGRSRTWAEGVVRAARAAAAQPTEQDQQDQDEQDDEQDDKDGAAA